MSGRNVELTVVTAPFTVVTISEKLVVNDVLVDWGVLLVALLSLESVVELCVDSEVELVDVSVGVGVEVVSEREVLLVNDVLSQSSRSAIEMSPHHGNKCLR